MRSRRRHNNRKNLREPLSSINSHWYQRLSAVDWFFFILFVPPMILLVLWYLPGWFALPLSFWLRSILWISTALLTYCCWGVLLWLPQHVLVTLAPLRYLTLRQKLCGAWTLSRPYLIFPLVLIALLPLNWIAGLVPFQNISTDPVTLNILPEGPTSREVSLRRAVWMLVKVPAGCLVIGLIIGVARAAFVRILRRE